MKYNKMQIWKFINMEPPSAAVYFFHLKSSPLRRFSYSFVFWNVHHRLLLRMFEARETQTDVYTWIQLSYPSRHFATEACSAATRPCADYGAISVYHLLSSFDEIFIQIFLSVRRRVVNCMSGNRFASGRSFAKGEFIIWQARSGDEILSISYETCIIFFIIATEPRRLIAVRLSYSILNFPHNFPSATCLTIIGFKALLWGANRVDNMCLTLCCHIMRSWCRFKVVKPHQNW